MPAASLPKKTIQLGAYYDAAATTREADYGTFFAGLSEDYSFSGSTRSVTLGRLRREIRNNPYLAGLVNKFPEAVGFSNLRSRTSDRLYNEAKDLFWFRYAKSVTVNGDSLRSVEEIIIRELLIAGEVFIYLLANGKIQLIPSEFCASPLNSSPLKDTSGNTEINGIIYASSGLPIGYRFGRMNSSGLLDFSNTEVVNARYIIHVYQKDRVQMGRGLPWLLASLRSAHDLYEITRSKTKQIKDANAITGTIEKVGADKFLGGLAAPEADGAPETTESPAEPVTQGPVTIELRNGTLIALEPGEKVNNLMSQYHASDYKELIMLMLHAVSSPVGLPVELWFSGLGDVNYSGFKGLGTQWNGRRRYIINFLEDRYLNRLHFWRISKAAKEGDLPPNPDGDDDLIQWAWRQTAVLDEEKQRKANAAGIASGEVSLADVWEEKGQYAEEVFAARRELWIKLQVAAGLIDADAYHTALEVPLAFLLRGELPGDSQPPAPAPAQATPAAPPETAASEPSAAPAVTTN
jgi:capsid protein